MTAVFSVRELTRNSGDLSDYDYVEIEDKKSKKRRGLFVSEKYADEVKAFIDRKKQLDAEKQKELLLQHAGIGTGDIGEKSFRELKSIHKGLEE